MESSRRSIALFLRIGLSESRFALFSPMLYSTTPGFSVFTYLKLSASNKGVSWPSQK
jgi:hypothetical protein